MNRAHPPERCDLDRDKAAGDRPDDGDEEEHPAGPGMEETAALSVLHAGEMRCAEREYTPAAMDGLLSGKLT